MLFLALAGGLTTRLAMLKLDTGLSVLFSMLVLVLFSDDDDAMLDEQLSECLLRSDMRENVLQHF